ncbi:uncharacterized protein LOC143626189 isoform X2 [Bidens hawaiensis]|uniref:uncharacterized protein LOC143626189 isoform X2 n=1 Tax=Bidens hawaiensis TaxID=980011 RepID=UPI00404A37B9
MKKSDSFNEEDHEQQDYNKNKTDIFRGLEEEEHDQDDDNDEVQQEQVNHNSPSTSRPKNGSTSSNSTVEESDKKTKSGYVRPYVRSKNPRLWWTPELHLRFIHAVDKLGGQERATPKLVLQMMNIKGLSISHVKSHLQMYRSKKFEDTAAQEQGLLYEGDDHPIYNLSQLPMLQSLTQKQIPNFSLWNHHMGQDYNHYVNGLISHGVYGSRAPRFIFENNISNLRPDERNNTEESRLRLLRDQKDIIINDQEKMLLKRKANNQFQDQENPDVDLNLSLQINTREDDNTENDEVGESDLSLSLFSSNSTQNQSSVRRSKYAKVDEGTSSTTLDLTL